MAEANFTVKNFIELLHKDHILDRFGLKRIGIFGSFARGEKYEDIDLLIDDENIDYQNIISLKKYLQQKLNVRIDIMIKKFADPIILHYANKDMIYAGN